MKKCSYVRKIRHCNKSLIFNPRYNRCRMGVVAQRSPWECFIYTQIDVSLWPLVTQSYSEIRHIINWYKIKVQISLRYTLRICWSVSGTPGSTASVWFIIFPGLGIKCRTYSWEEINSNVSLGPRIANGGFFRRRFIMGIVNCVA